MVAGHPRSKLCIDLNTHNHEIIRRACTVGSNKKLTYFWFGSLAVPTTFAQGTLEICLQGSLEVRYWYGLVRYLFIAPYCMYLTNISVHKFNTSTLHQYTLIPRINQYCYANLPCHLFLIVRVAVKWGWLPSR